MNDKLLICVRRWRSCLTALGFLIGILTAPVWGGDILMEDGPERVVSGDCAARMARGIGMDVSPCDLSAQHLETALLKCDVELPAGTVEALREGLRRYGWAQFEQEPERVGKRQKVRVYVGQGDEEKLRIEDVDLYDQIVATAETDWRGGAIQVERFDPDPSSDPTVYASLLSVENMILSQEHYVKQFFESMLNLDWPGLENAKAAYQSDRPALAIYEVCEYFRRKTEPAEFIVPARLQAKAQEPPKTVPAAETICRHIFNFYGMEVDMGDRIDWDRQPNDHGEWLWRFNHHQHFAVLAQVYRETANEKYAKEFVAQITDWIIQNPAPPYTLTRVGTWRNLEAGSRCSGSWPSSFYGFLNSVHFTPQAIQLVLGSLWSHGDYIHEHPAGLRRPSNWSVVDSTGLAALGTHFPEFRESARWREVGFERLTKQLELQVYPDGAQWELTPGYHIMCLGRFEHGLRLAQSAERDAYEDFARRVESMYEYLMWIAKPDLTSPAWSDASPGSRKSLLLEGARRFERADMQYVATQGREGKPPESPSKLLAWSGYAIMRSGWDANALYLGFDGGPVGSNHQHEDKLAIVLSAYGRNFLIDPGPSSYTKNEWRRHALSTAAHSTISIDGYGQRRIENKQEHLASETPDPVWLSNDRFDYSRALYSSGYGLDRMPVTHERQVFFKKNEYWVVVDTVEGEGTHTVESLFHLAPDFKLTLGDRHEAITDVPDGPNLMLLPASRESLNARIVEGQTTPAPQGWYLPDKITRVPAPVVSYRLERELPVTLAYLLYPTPTGEKPDADLAITEVDDVSIQLTVARPGKKTDRIRLVRTGDRVELLSE